MHRKHIKDELLILRRFAVNENDLLISAFGKNLGKINLKAKGSKRINSQFTGKLEPLSIIKTEIYFSGKSYTLTNATSLINPPIDQDLKTFATSQKICGMLLRTLPNEEPNQALFEYIKELIPLLSNNTKGEELLTIFYIKYMDITGHLPNTQFHDELKNLSQEAIKVIKFYSQTRPNDSIKLVLPQNTRKELNTHLEAMFQEYFY
jgi:DNA repair protein RecO